MTLSIWLFLKNFSYTHMHTSRKSSQFLILTCINTFVWGECLDYYLIDKQLSYIMCKAIPEQFVNTDLSIWKVLGTHC